ATSPSLFGCALSLPWNGSGRLLPEVTHGLVTPAYAMGHDSILVDPSLLGCLSHRSKSIRASSDLQRQEHPGKLGSTTVTRLLSAYTTCRLAYASTSHLLP